MHFDILLEGGYMAIHFNFLLSYHFVLGDRPLSLPLGGDDLSLSTAFPLEHFLGAFFSIRHFWG